MVGSLQRNTLDGLSHADSIPNIDAMDSGGEEFAGAVGGAPVSHTQVTYKF